MNGLKPGYCAQGQEIRLHQERGAGFKETSLGHRRQEHSLRHMNITLNAQSLEKELEKARGSVAASGLPAALAAVDDGAFGTTQLNLQALEAVSGALACARAASAAGAVPPVYAGYILAREAGERLLGLRPPRCLKRRPAGRQYKTWAALAPDRFREMLSDCAAFLKFYAGHSDGARRPARDSEAVRCLNSYFSLLARALKALDEEPELSVSGGKLTFTGWKTSRAGADEPGRLLPVGFDDMRERRLMAAQAARARWPADLSWNPKKNRSSAWQRWQDRDRHATAFSWTSAAGCSARVRDTPHGLGFVQNQSSKSLLIKNEVFDFDGVRAVYWPDRQRLRRRSDSTSGRRKNILGTCFLDPTAP